MADDRHIENRFWFRPISATSCRVNAKFGT